MSGISAPMSAEHRRCDEAFVALEQAIARGRWQEAGLAMEGFRTDMERHFVLEEETLFPALRQAAPGASGPIQVMLMEHTQMRQLMETLAQRVKGRSTTECLSVTETLVIVMQQHNRKEETILYPMGDGAIGTLAGISEGAS